MKEAFSQCLTVFIFTLDERFLQTEQTFGFEIIFLSLPVVEQQFIFDFPSLSHRTPQHGQGTTTANLIFSLRSLRPLRLITLFYPWKGYSILKRFFVFAQGHIP